MSATGQNYAGSNANQLINNPEKGAEVLWEKHGFGFTTRQNGVQVTAPVQSVQRHAGEEKLRNFWKRKQLGLQYEDGEQHKGGPGEETRDKAVDSTIAETPTPLVFDPEILELYKSNAPFVAVVPEEGQQGYKAVFNKIDSRDDPMGFVDEGTSLDLISNSSEFSMDRDEQAMKIFVDAVRVSEFSDRASAHYMDLADTALGTRVAEHAQHKEKSFLYADPTAGGATPLTDGSPYDANAYSGLEKIFGDAGNKVDKATTDIGGTDGLLRDIKAEIKDLMQGPYNINKSDLMVVTSHTLFDQLENELEVKARYNDETSSVDFGIDTIRVSQVPVMATHNVDEHTFDDGSNSYTVGSEGDAFIVNLRALRFRSLMPLSTIPLAKQGWSDQMGLGEFGALIERSGGNFGKMLADYAI